MSLVPSVVSEEALEGSLVAGPSITAVPGRSSLVNDTGASPVGSSLHEDPSGADFVHRCFPLYLGVPSWRVSGLRGVDSSGDGVTAWTFLALQSFHQELTGTVVPLMSDNLTVVCLLMKLGRDSVQVSVVSGGRDSLLV